MDKSRNSAILGFFRPKADNPTKKTANGFCNGILTFCNAVAVEHTGGRSGKYLIAPFGDWKNGGGTNPDLDIRKLITSVGDKGGVNANRVLIGDAAWTYRLESLLGSQNVASGGQAMFTIDNLRGFVGAEKILTCDKRFETKVKDSDGKAAKEYKAFLANYVLAFNARDGISKFDPSTFKRFVGEEGFQVYVEKKTKCTIVTVEHYSLLAQTGVGACKGLTVANS